MKITARAVGERVEQKMGTVWCKQNNKYEPKCPENHNEKKLKQCENVFLAKHDILNHNIKNGVVEKCEKARGKILNALVRLNKTGEHFLDEPKVGNGTWSFRRWCRWIEAKTINGNCCITFRCDNYGQNINALKLCPVEDCTCFNIKNDKSPHDLHDFMNIGKIQFVKDSPLIKWESARKKWEAPLPQENKVWPYCPGEGDSKKIYGKEAEELARLPSRLLLRVLSEDYKDCYFHIDNIVDEHGGYVEGGEKLSECIAEIFAKWALAG